MLNNFTSLISTIQQKNILSSEDLHTKTFIDLLQLLSLHHINPNLSNFAIFEMFIYLLSPHYILNSEKLILELQQMFVRKGGVYCKDFSMEATNFLQFKQQLTGLYNLSSFENIKVCGYCDLDFLSEHSSHSDKNENNNENKSEVNYVPYSVFNWTQIDSQPNIDCNKLSYQSTSKSLSTNIIISDVNSMLEDIPYIEIEYINNNNHNFCCKNYYVPLKKDIGVNLHYYKKKILNYVNRIANAGPTFRSADPFTNITSCNNKNYLKYSDNKNYTYGHKKIKTKFNNNKDSNKIVVRGHSMINTLIKVNQQITNTNAND